jgi:hypothetical protein
MTGRVRDFVRRNYIVLGWAVLLIGLAANAGIQAGFAVLLVLVLAGAGMAAVVAGLGYTSGSFVVKHAEKTQREIAGGHQQQIRAAIEADVNPRELLR